MQNQGRNSGLRLRATVIFPSIYIGMIVICFATGGNGDTFIGDLTLSMSWPLGYFVASLIPWAPGESGMIAAGMLALIIGVFQYLLIGLFVDYLLSKRFR